MLKTLSIKNYTLIDEVNINFSEKFNIFIGETGAGKSVIVGALMLALGGRAMTEQIRKDKDKTIIEALFEFPDAHPVFSFFDNNDIDRIGNEIITRREIYSRGTSRCFINDTPVPVSQLKILGERIANFHAQHDNQLILKPEIHLEFLDLYIENDKILEELENEYYKLEELIKKLDLVKSQEKELRLQHDAYEFELNEILKINPKPGEDEKLENDLKILENAELLIENLNNIINTLYKNESSVYSGITSAGKMLEKLIEIDNRFSPWLDELQSTSVIINEITKFAQDYSENIDFNPQKIEEIRLRLLAINGLKKKYGDFDEIFKRIEYLNEKLSLAENFNTEIEKLSKAVTKSKLVLGSIAGKLSKLRKKKSKDFTEELINKLKELHLENSVFRMEFTHKKISKYQSVKSVTCIIDDEEYVCSVKGIDTVKFFISTNKGETPKPLSTVASGGELSRIMLAMKTLIAKKYKIPVLIFDEIDTGISGRVAQKVGLAIRELSKSHQIIAITHLAQIAAMGDKIISVRKNENKGNTTVNIKEENDETKVIEIAKLISGENVSEASLRTVNELLEYQH